MKKVRRNRICALDGCSRKATELATGRRYRDEPGYTLAWYCGPHAESVADQGNPEYVAHCPACSCAFGVN